MTGRTKGFARWFLFGALIVSLAGLFGCGGGGDEAAPALGVFNKTVVQGGAFDNVQLFGTDNALKGQILLLADEVNGSGFARSISFKLYGQQTGGSVDNVTIKLGHTSPLAGDNLSTTFASNVENGKGSLVTVYGPAPLGIPGGADNAVFTIPLNGKFNYNGVDDLVIQITAGRSVKELSVRGAQTSPARIVFVGTDNAASPTANSSGTSLPDMKITFAGGVDRLNRPGALNEVPFNTDPARNKVQWLYMAKDIDGSGLITGIGFQVSTNFTGTVGGSVGDNTLRCTVRLGHTRRGQLTTGFDNNFNAGAPVTVLDNQLLTFSPTYPADGAWFWIPFTTPFGYNGVDNLVVEVKVFNVNGIWITLNRDTNGVNTMMYGAVGDNVANTSYSDRRFATQFRFAGATVDVISDGAGNDFAPFGWGSNATVQNLYRNTELGSRGVVTKLAVRLNSPVTTAKAFDNMVFTLAYNDNAALGSSFAGNMSGPVTVFRGTFNMPAGLKQGDWIEIPLQTPFVYDAKRHLVVKTLAPAVTSGGVSISANAAPAYGPCWAESASLTTDTVTFLENFLWDLRLTVVP